MIKCSFWFNLNQWQIDGTAYMGKFKGIYCWMKMNDQKYYIDSDVYFLVRTKLLNYMINLLKINFLKIVFSNIVDFEYIHRNFLLNYNQGNLKHYRYNYRNYFRYKELLDLLDHQLVVYKIGCRPGNLK